jgi:hypothetical protein
MPHAGDYEPCDADLTQLDKGKAALSRLKKRNPGMMIKIGGTKKGSKRKTSAQYSHKYFRKYLFKFLPGFTNLTDSNLAGWLELELIKFAFHELKIGVNDNRGQSPNSSNKANLPGTAYSESNRGCICFCPACEKYTSQASFFDEHVSYYCKVQAKKRKGTFVKHDPSTRKQQERAPPKAPYQKRLAKDHVILNALNAPRDLSSQFRNLTPDQRKVAVKHYLKQHGGPKVKPAREATKLMDRLLKFPLLFAHHLE